MVPINARWKLAGCGGMEKKITAEAGEAASRIGGSTRKHDQFAPNVRE